MIHGELTNLPVINVQDRNLLIDSAICLNCYVAPEKHYPARLGKVEVNGKRSGDVFNAQADWSFLLKHGWLQVGQSHNRILWKPPGKETVGISATTGYCKGQDGTELFYVFSTNASPLRLGDATAHLPATPFWSMEVILKRRHTH